MRIGILSDTHDRLARTQFAVKLLQERGAEALIHCGDVTTAPVILACGVLPLWFVFGNNDADNLPELRAAANEVGATCLEWGGSVELGGRRLGVVHGHLRTDLRRVLAESPDYVFSGHSHVALDVMVDSVRRINPGALHRASRFTVATLDLALDTVEFLPVETVGG